MKKLANKSVVFLVFVFLLPQLCRAQIYPDQVPDVLIANTPGYNQTENAVFISPVLKYVVINANNSGIYTSPSVWDISYFISANGGVSWTGSVSGPDPNSHGDPSVVITRSGRTIVSNLAWNSPGTRTISISYTDDDTPPFTWTTVQIPGSNYADKEHLWVDNNLNSPYQGRIYMAFNDAFSSWFDIVFTYSDDGGELWLAPPLENISSTLYPQPNYENLGVNIQTGPQGHVYACWSAIDFALSTTPNNTRIIFNKSLDGGDTWLNNATEIITITGLQGTLAGGKYGSKCFPSMAVNQQTGTIYIVFDVNDATGNNIDGNIYMIKSEDDGDTWSTIPIKVNQDATTNDQWDPWIACDEISNALIVVYYDSRDDNTQANTYLSISYNDGNTWEDYKISDESWDGISSAFMFGAGMEYIQVDVYHGLAIPVWSDKRPSAGAEFRVYTNPFEVPCPQDLDLIYGNYNIYDQGDYTDYPEQLYDGLYKTSGTINVAGGGSTYKVQQGAEVLMEAGEEIVLNDGFETEGEFQAIPNPICTSFSRKLEVSNSTDIINNNSKGTDSKEEENHNQVATEKNNIVSGNLQIQIFPNPSSSGLFNVKIYETRLTGKLSKDDNTSYSINIYDSFGQIVQSITNSETSIEIDISDLSKGAYFIHVIDNINTKTIGKGILVR